MAPPTQSQTYLSSRGGNYNVSFEQCVIRGLAPDGGLFLPSEIPKIDWTDDWTNWSFQELAFKIFSLYISQDEIPEDDLRRLVEKSYSKSTFRAPDIAPLITLDEEKNLHLLELFHGSTFAFKDVALQFVGNLFEYFLVRANGNKPHDQRDHLTVIGATSGDTGSAAIHGLKGKQDLSVFMTFPKGRTSPVQEAQMSSILDANVHNLEVEDGTFDDCQALVKDLFNDKDLRKTHMLAAVNSINWARILAQITYYFHAYATLRRSGKLRPGDRVRCVIPSGNFGNALAGFFAKRMSLDIEKIVVGTNENDILDVFWKSGFYGKHAATESNGTSSGLDSSMVRETYSPAMDILVSSNFERLLWYLALETHGFRQNTQTAHATAGAKVTEWLAALKSNGGFTVPDTVLSAAKIDFESERVSDDDTLACIRDTYQKRAKHGAPYVLDPHTAVGIATAYRSMARAPPPTFHHIAMATAHPAKFAVAVQRALDGVEGFVFADSVPVELRDLEALPKRKIPFRKSEGVEALKRMIMETVPGRASSTWGI